MDHPIKGDRVTIKKGSIVRSFHRGNYILKRNQTVTVFDHFEVWDYEGIHHPACISWPGSGGYWCYTDLSNLLEKP